MSRGACHSPAVATITACERALWTSVPGDDLLDAQHRERVVEAGAPEMMLQLRCNRSSTEPDKAGLA